MGNFVNILIGFVTLFTTTFLTVYNISHVSPYTIESFIVGVAFIFTQSFWMIIMLNHTSIFFRIYFYKAPARNALNDYPKVAIVIPTYKEPIEVLSRTVKCALNQDYPEDKYRIVIVDDSPEEYVSEIRRLCEKNGEKISFLKRNNRDGFRAGALNVALETLDEDYMIVLDVDHAPKPVLIRTLVEYIHGSDYDVIMFPQYFSNMSISPVAYASSLCQIHDYLFNRKGRSVTNSAFCVGTNWIGKVSRIRDVGGFHDSSIVEDLSTSMILWHPNGIKIGFIEETLAEGLAPETITAFENQQYRWAYGTFKLVPEYLRVLRKLTGFQKFDYLNVFIWYLIGIVMIISSLFPLITALGIKFLVFQSITEYSLIVLNFTILQYILFSLPLLMFYRSFIKVFKAQSISMIALVSYVKALFNSVLDMITGKCRAYIVTDKRQSSSYVRNLVKRGW